MFVCHDVHTESGGCNELLEINFCGNMKFSIT